MPELPEETYLGGDEAFGDVVRGYSANQMRDYGLKCRRATLVAVLPQAGESTRYVDINSLWDAIGAYCEEWAEEELNACGAAKIEGACQKERSTRNALAALIGLRTDEPQKQAGVNIYASPASLGEAKAVAWEYSGNPEEGKDARCIVTLLDAGMTWVGIRAWNHQGKYWMNGNERERCQVLAWKPLDDPAKGRWVRGQLIGATPVAQALPVAAEKDARDVEIDRLNKIINTPHDGDFIKAVSIEGEHQRQRWGADSDAGKTPADWFWLVGYFAGKALHAHVSADTKKAEHHVITTAAACLNWHLAMFGETDMRPGHANGVAAMQGGNS